MTADDQLTALLRATFGSAFKDRRDECRAFFAQTWGARAIPARRGGAAAIQTAVVHHSGVVGDRSGAETVWRFHRDTRQWATPGYGVWVARDGSRVELWVGPERITNGVWGLNGVAYHVETPGDYRTDEPDAGQLDALYRVLCCIDDALAPRSPRWRGHREVALPGHGTACPGPKLLAHVWRMRGVAYGAAGLVGQDRPAHYP